MLTVIGDGQKYMKDYISMMGHKSFLTDQQRNAAIPIMTNNKMDPLTSYGNASMYVKNDFNGGIVNINNSDINTTPLGGAFSTTELWMSTYRTLKAKEQMYDNYQRLFKHTRPSNQTDTWTTGLTTKKNFNETWGVYTDGLTFTANFDKGCNITYTQQGDAGVLNSSTTSYRSETPISLSAPNITQGGVTYKFVNWEDGSTSNPRTLTATQHQTCIATYKGVHVSGTSTAYANSSARKFVRTPDNVLHQVYEAGGRCWYEISWDNGTSWQFTNGGKPLDAGAGKNPSIEWTRYWYWVEGGGGDFASGQSSAIEAQQPPGGYWASMIKTVVVFQEQNGSGFKIKAKHFDDYRDFGNGTAVDIFSTSEYYSSVNANPVVCADSSGYVTFVWESKAGSGGLYCRVAHFNNTDLSFSTSAQIITGTNLYSTNPAISVSRKRAGNTIRNLTWQQNNGSSSSINYCLIGSNGNISGSISNISNGTNYPSNCYRPSINISKRWRRKNLLGC